MDNLDKLKKLQKEGKTNIGIYNEEYPISKGIEYYERLRGDKK